VAIRVAMLGFRVYGWWRCCHMETGGSGNVDQILPLFFSAWHELLGPLEEGMSRR
jgi:hypothetical protein